MPQCRSRGISNGKPLFSPCFCFPLQWKNNMFSPIPSSTSTFGNWVMTRCQNPQQNTSCYHLRFLGRSPQGLRSPRGGCSPAASVCCHSVTCQLSPQATGKGWHSSLLCQEPILGASCQQFPSLELQFSLSCSVTLLFLVYAGQEEKKTPNKWSRFFFPR